MDTNRAPEQRSVPGHPLVALLFALAPAAASTLRLVPIAVSKVAGAQVYRWDARSRSLPGGQP